MNRRADRTIAVAALAAVAIVPTVLLAALKVSGPDSVGPQASAPRTTAAGDGTRVRTLQGATPAGLTPSPWPSGSAPAPSTAPTTGRTTPKPKPGQAPVVSYARTTEAWLSGAPSGDNQHLTEETTFVLAPSFSMDARGTRVNTVGGTPTTTTQRVVVKDRTLSTYDGADNVKHTKLSDDQLAVLGKQGDARQFTLLMRLVPGSQKETDALGATRYAASVLLQDVIDRLPQDQAEEIKKVLPLTTLITADLWADREDRPTWIQLTATAPEVDLKVVMTFSGYR